MSAEPAGAGPARRRTRLLAALLVLLLAGLGWLMRAPVELTKIRNSFVADIAAPQDYDWAPPDYPAGFKLDTGRAPAAIDAAVRAVLSIPDTVDPLARALALARHLNSGPPARGTPLQTTTVDAYRRILESGRGYCADYTQVYGGLALAAALAVREWGMSFGDFNGTGHAFSEVYVPERGKWVLIDTHKSFFVVDSASRAPLSALEFRDRLRARDRDFEIVPISEKRFAAKARGVPRLLAFYEKGIDRMFLLAGNNVFSYFEHPVVAALEGLPRPIEQIAAILVGEYPRMKIIATETNRDAIESLLRTRYVFLFLVAGSLLVSALLLRAVWRSRRPRAPA